MHGARGQCLLAPLRLWGLARRNIITRSLQADTFAAGKPCRMIRKIVA
jgi:hypothetical protein